MAFADNVGLLFKIRADSTDAEKELKKISGIVDSETSKVEKSSTGSFDKVGGSLAGLAAPAGIAAAAIGTIAVARATAAGVLFSITKNFADAGTEIKNFQNLTGLTAASISTIKVASDAAGVSLDNFEEVWESFSETLIEAGKGNEEAGKKLKSAGIDAAT